MTIKEKKKILDYLKLCFPLCGTNFQRMDELTDLIEKLKNEISENEAEEDYINWALEQERNLYK